MMPNPTPSKSKKQPELIDLLSPRHGDDTVLSYRTPVRRSSRPSSSASSNENDDERMLSDAKSTTTKRKRQSLSTSTMKAMANCSIHSTKKRARTSEATQTCSCGTPTKIATPGKATPLTATREQHVAKSFVELQVSEVYRAIRKQTGALGGNAAGGAIYGEITQNSFQRIVDYMKEKCELSSKSLFLDVGSGLGKPNFHVAIDPGVEVSYGIELEELRWQLSLHNLKSVLLLDSAKGKRNRTMFTAGDITDAKTLNPFSHIYSFDVGFPPTVMEQYATIFNRSNARFLASFHAPKKIMEVYGFAVEHMGRVATSMAGSSEGHTCYFYKRTSANDLTQQEHEPSQELLHIDPLFRVGFDVLQRGKDGVLSWILSFFGEQVYSGRTRRQKAQQRQTFSSKQQQTPLEAYYRVVGKARPSVGNKTAAL